jgi:hypothetical protein
MIMPPATIEVKKESRYAYILTATYAYEEIAALIMIAPAKIRAIEVVRGFISVIFATKLESANFFSL